MSETVLRRVSSNSIRKLSTVVEPVRSNEEPLHIFRTSENNPANHTKEHLKRFYTMPPEEKQRLFQSGGFRKSFEVDIKTFAECCIMVRQPALEIISYLRQSDYTKPINKYVICILFKYKFCKSSRREFLVFAYFLFQIQGGRRSGKPEHQGKVSEFEKTCKSRSQN